MPSDPIPIRLSLYGSSGQATIEPLRLKWDFSREGRAVAVELGFGGEPSKIALDLERRTEHLHFDLGKVSGDIDLTFVPAGTLIIEWRTKFVPKESDEKPTEQTIDIVITSDSLPF